MEMVKRILLASSVIAALVIGILAGTGESRKTALVREAWEYKVLAPLTSAEESELNKLGADGWELVASQHLNASGGDIFYLKRRK